jgi:hypothetical protein
MKSKILNEFDSIMTGDYGNAILYTGVVGLALSDKFPTPSPLLATFSLNKYKREYERGDIDVFEYKQGVEKALNMYKYLWWGGVFATMYFTKGNAYDKAKIGGILLGIGVVASLLIKKPEIKAEALIDEPETEQINFSADKKQAYRRGNFIKFV